MSEIEIINYEDKYKLRVKALNHEWLRKYDLWEPIDDEYLDHPKEKILDKGGSIFLVRANSDIIGTASIVTYEDTAVEICKVCVSEKWKGQGIGLALMRKCIEEARNLGAKKILLYSNQKLENALKLYFKLGFKEIVDTEGKYKTSDVKMEMNL
jgi:ribosomal protein S18 acetylase RimI-like enzyme